MTDREIKNMLKDAYVMPETEKERIFVRRHEKRSMQMPDIIKNEFRYMGVKSMCAGFVLCVLLYLLARDQDPDMVWTLSSLVPTGALIPMILLSGSERFGMDELEAVSRFSLRYIRIVRMFIMGIFSLLLLSAVSLILRANPAFRSADRLLLAAVPYLFSTYGAMVVTRRWHGRDNILGVLAVCLFSGLIPHAVRSARLPGQIPDKAVIFLIAALLAAIVREGGLYLKESEDLSWNFC